MTTAAMQRASGAHWRAHAAVVVAAFPLAGTDWDQHDDAVNTGFYSVRDFLAPPLSPEEEEAATVLF